MRDTLPRGPFRSRKDIVLASASPRRQDLLQRLGIDFLVRVSTAREPDWTEATESPADFVLSAARSKAENVLSRIPRGVVIAADTAIALEGEVLGKAGNEAQALSMLHRLAGRRHNVLTGCCLREKNWGEETFVASTEVAMPSLAESTLRAYIRTGEYEGKAGAYAIQGVGAFLVQGINGSYTNVVGLPLQEVLFCLQRMDAIETFSEEQA
jgi:septum formation protein